TSSATRTIPCSSQIRRRPAMNSVGATTKPPSPWTGSTTIAATDDGATCVANARSSAASACAAVTPRYSYGNGSRYTSGTNGPRPSLYGFAFDVSVSARYVRPWKAPSNAITAGLPVASRANLTAFSTASVPALKNAALTGAGIG